MNNHLMPPFILREARIEVNDTPKIQIDNPDLTDHSIYFSESDLRIHLSLWGIFPYFITTKPTPQMLEECEDIYILTPSRWDPHNTAYVHNVRLAREHG